MKTFATKILYFVTIPFCLLSLACVQASVETVSSNAVQAAQVYRIYAIQASAAKTEAVAAFRVGGATGTTLELNAPAKILYNDEAMPVSAPGNLIGTNYRVKGTDYRTSFQQYSPAHKFSYTDAKGKTYVNSITLAPVEIAAKNAIRFDNLKPTVIPLSRAIGASETLTISLDSVIDNAIPTNDDSVFLNASRNAVVIAPNYWKTKSLESQTELKIKIKKSGTVSNAAPLGGSISATYSAASVSVKIPVVKRPAKTLSRSKTN